MSSRQLFGRLFVLVAITHLTYIAVIVTVLLKGN